MDDKEQAILKGKDYKMKVVTFRCLQDEIRMIDEFRGYLQLDEKIDTVSKQSAIRKMLRWADAERRKQIADNDRAEEQLYESNEKVVKMPMTNYSKQEIFDRQAKQARKELGFHVE